MTYNRCVGTRYCSNNCPYKVRRFNFLRYYEDGDPLAHAPGQSRRHRPLPRRDGEVHLLRPADQRGGSKPRSKRPTTESRSAIVDGTIVTACQAACPARAIVFGDINDKRARVAKWQEIPQKYGVLEELGTRPRTTYLPRVTNPSPLLAAVAHSEGGQPR